ncbi:MAG: protein-glutamate O-methyltransferase CheR [Polyangia bacterium]
MADRSDITGGTFVSAADSDPDGRTHEALRLVRDFIYEQTGNWFEDGALYLLRRRLASRLPALALPDFHEYQRVLRASPESIRKAELDEIADRVTTNETYFFRERSQLDSFSEHLLPRLAHERARSRRLGIWSAGCSSGEEVYTIAMLILESGLFTGWDVRVFGSDISRKALRTARTAEYGPGSFRVTDEARIERWFDVVDGKHRVKYEVRDLCRFGQINLVDSDATSVLGTFDVAFCRNVLIYFDAESRKRVISTLERKLHPGGYLLLGHSESLAALAAELELVHLPNDLVYRRPPVRHT